MNFHFNYALQRLVVFLNNFGDFTIILITLWRYVLSKSTFRRDTVSGIRVSRIQLIHVVKWSYSHVFQRRILYPDTKFLHLGSSAAGDKFSISDTDVTLCQMHVFRHAFFFKRLQLISLAHHASVVNNTLKRKHGTHNF
jgi:hypothetical protein